MIVGNYRVGRVIASGGMATVFRGVYRPTGMPVAIKVLSELSAHNDVLVRRMNQESRIQNILGRQHDGIVTCYEPFRFEGRPGLVLEFVPGHAVTDILEASGPLGPVESIDIALRALDALGFAHAHGVIHRDIKPENIMVSTRGVVKLTDFGVARAEIDSFRPRLTESRDIVGTMVYMAPEQLTSPRSIDQRADLYGVGVTLFEMLTNELPFDGEEGYPLMKRIEMEPPEDPRELNSDVPLGLSEVVLTALSKAPDERFFSTAEMAAALLEVRAEIAEGNPPSLPDSPMTSRRVSSRQSFQPGEPVPHPQPRSYGWVEDESGTIAPGRVFIRRGGIILGRSKSCCDLVIPDDRIAAEHTLLLPLEVGGVLVVDLCTDHGTHIDSRAVEREFLHAGEVLELGGHWKFRYCL